MEKTKHLICKSENGGNMEIDKKELFNLLKEAYRHGYAQYEMVESGLERYDAEGYANWVIKKLK